MPLLPKYFQIMLFREKPITKCVGFFYRFICTKTYFVLCYFETPYGFYRTHTLSVTHRCSASLEGEGGGVKRSDRNYSSDSLSAERLSITALYLLAAPSSSSPSPPHGSLVLLCFRRRRRLTCLIYLPLYRSSDVSSWFYLKEFEVPAAGLQLTARLTGTAAAPLSSLGAANGHPVVSYEFIPKLNFL